MHGSGRDPVATLSARLSGRGELYAYSGKWYFEEGLPPLMRQRLAELKEAADNPAKDKSAASLFQTSEGGRDGPALTS